MPVAARNTLRSRVAGEGGFDSDRGRDHRMSVIIDFSIFPIGKGESVSDQVSRAVKIIRESGLPFKLGPMGTAIEGEWDDVMAVVTRCFEALKKECNRVYMTIKVDYRKGESGRMAGKIETVDRKS
jgi:uncharacterized protein (TIGR00106 family)